MKLSDRWFGFLSGLFAALIGFLFAVAWDCYKWNRMIIQRDETMFSVLDNIIFLNEKILYDNIVVLKKEIKALDNNRSVVGPLTEFHENFWVLFSSDLPQIIKDKPENLISMRNLFSIVARSNELLRSREAYRVNNESMSNYGRRLKYYDEQILDLLKRMKKELNAMKEILGEGGQSPAGTGQNEGS